MRNAKKVIIIGIDSGDKHLLDKWIDEGFLPTFKALKETSAWGVSINPRGLAAGTVWPTFYLGVLPGRTGRFRGTTQFMAGTYKHGSIEQSLVSYKHFWEILSNAGKKVAVVDAPYAFLSKDINGFQLVDWTSHSPWKDGVTVSNPPELADSVKREYGCDPVGKCDFAKLDNLEDFRRFRDGLVSRIAQKKRFMLDRIKQNDIDVFLSIFSECHCVGHQCWHIHDPAHPSHDAEALRVLGDPMRDVYRAMDDTIGEIIAVAGEDTSVLVLCSHGIGPAFTGTHILDEILLRLEKKKTPKKRQFLAQNMVRIWTTLPQAWRTKLTPLQKRLWPTLKATLVQPNKAARKYFEVIINDATGGIRLNVVGREPDGRIRPEEYDAVCDELEKDLLEVINLKTNQPLVKQVIKTADHYKGEHVDRLPDLLVEWNRAGPIGNVTSPKIGTITHKFKFENHRTGDHMGDTDGVFFVKGPTVEPGELPSPVSVADLAPTITALLGVSMGDIDGKPLSQALKRKQVVEPDKVAVGDLVE